MRGKCIIKGIFGYITAGGGDIRSTCDMGMLGGDIKVVRRYS